MRARQSLLTLIATPLVLLATFTSASTRAQGTRDTIEQMRRIPDGVIAWWVYNPGALGNGGEGTIDRRVIEGALRIALSSGMVEGETAEILTGLLAGCAFSDAPSRVCLLDIQTEPDTSPGAAFGDWHITSISAVVEIHTNTRQPALLQTVKSVFLDSPATGSQTSGGVSQKQITLANGQAAVVLQQAPNGTTPVSLWSEVSWTSEPGVFTLAIGRDTLSDWIRRRDAHNTADVMASHWQVHRDTIDAGTAQGSVFAEVYVNIDAMRDRFETSLLYGRTDDVLNVSNIGNMRDVMLHARLVDASLVRIDGGLPNATYNGPPLIELDATWSTRREKPGIAHTHRVADSVWPAWLITYGPPPGTYAMVVDLDWERTVAWFLATKRSMLDADERVAFNQKLRAWSTRYNATLKRLAQSFESQVVLTDVPRSPVALPGVCTLLCEAKPSMNYDRLLRDLDSILGSAHKSVKPMHDKLMWSVSILPENTDPAGILSVFAAGLAGNAEKPVLVAGWSSLTVTHTQERLGRPTRK
ncbi:MAG: hypothetical protein H6815_03515 [Phycisphaeraceae bacterium]|nr:hypothetical protein [Phycisphaerales bacterium]MCB9859496.1 hypothetical protein [Phycisphaeraceae bacterium]